MTSQKGSRFKNFEILTSRSVFWLKKTYTYQFLDQNNHFIAFSKLQFLVDMQFQDCPAHFFPDLDLEPQVDPAPRKMTPKISKKKSGCILGQRSTVHKVPRPKKEKVTPYGSTNVVWHIVLKILNLGWFSLFLHKWPILGICVELQHKIFELLNKSDIFWLKWGVNHLCTITRSQDIEFSLFWFLWVN